MALDLRSTRAQLRVASRALLLPTLAAVTWLALVPAPPPQADTGWDKANHAMAFAVLALLAEGGWGPGRARAIAAALLAYGALIELLQTQLPPRSGEWGDWLADAVGVALGLLAARAVRWFVRRPPASPGR
ncbi:MAG: VanZ family protein [Rubrivivax sp.]